MENQPSTRSFADLLRAQSGGFQAAVLRVFDVVLAMIGLIMAVPLLLPIAALIKLESRGPVVFRDERVGKDMKRFSMFKLRTMLECSTRIRQSVCPRHDPRVTSFGRFLRKSKLNELPQLFNVLLGDMSFVGPRPEASDLAEMYPEEARILFRVKPGLVGPSVVSVIKGNISGRNEEELYPPGVDPKLYYIEHILPIKLKVELYYLSRQTIASYFGVIFSAVRETVTGALSSRPTDGDRRASYLFIADIVFCQISFAIAYQLFIWLPLTRPSVRGFLSGILLVTAVRPVINYAAGLYNLVLDLVTPRDAFPAIRGVALGSLVMLTVGAALRIAAYPPEVAVLDFLLLGTMLTTIRLFILWKFHTLGAIHAGDRRIRALVYGAQRQGLSALCALGGSKSSPYRVIGFLDDQESKYGKRIRGLKVLGNRHHIRALSILYDIQEIILALPEGQEDQIPEIVALCARAGIPAKIYSLSEGPLTGRTFYPLRPVCVTDVLPRASVTLDVTMLRSLVSNRTVLMFGSGGELGSALCRMLFACGGRRLVLVDRYESQVGEILADLRSDLPGFHVVPEILDTQDIDRLNAVFDRHRPRIVIHAGLRKYSSPRPSDDDEVALSNYFRTFNLARASESYGCEYFVAISSLRAACRGSFVSESLRIAEISLHLFFRQTPTRLLVARVGNIIENRGGLVSELAEQILDHRSVRLPAEASRAYLLSKNAAALSILQSLVLASKISPGGFLHTSERGSCLKLTEIVERLCSFYGLTAGSDVIVKFGEIPGGLIDDEPSIEVTQSFDDEKSLRAIRPSDLECLRFENIVSCASRQSENRDWRQRTADIVEAYGPFLFVQNGSVQVH